MHLPKNQRGASQILLPLFLVAAIAIGVYLARQQTELTPSAEEAVTQAPSGCVKVTPSNRQVRYKNCSSSSQNCTDQTNLLSSNQEQDNNADWTFDGKKVATYALKEAVWDFGSNWKGYTTKGPRQADGDRLNVGKPRIDGPNGQSYHETNTTEISNGYKIKYGDGQVIEYAYYTSGGTNYQGVPGNKYDPSRSYAFVPSDSNSNTKCDGTGSGSVGSKNNNDTCSQGNECQSGVCSGGKCSQGSKKGGDACKNSEECQSNSCDNGKCTGGSTSTGSSCSKDSDCASNRCGSDKKCVAPSPSPNKSASPKASSGSSGGGGNNNGGGTSSPSPSGSINPSSNPSPSGSPISSSSPSPNASGSPAVINLTKSEIIGFKASFDALYSRLGTTKDTGNLKVVSTIANTELTSIVSQLPTCPDDANVGPCLDQKFRTRFDFAKTAARLSAFYAIFNGVSGICVKSDFGLNPLITASSTSNTQGRVNLCTEPTAAQKIWRIFANGKFEPVLASDTRWPANPTCASLPQDVLTHYRNAETLFNTQAGFTQNTLCNGKTSVAPEGSASPSP